MAKKVFFMNYSLRVSLWPFATPLRASVAAVLSALSLAAVPTLASAQAPAARPGAAASAGAPIKLALIESLSGPFANTGEAVFRNIFWAAERVNAIDDGARVVMQGNSSATAAALLDAINKHNEREPGKRVLFLNYSAVDPILTNEKCSFWHFRFDAHADMRMAALMEVVREDKALKSVYLIGQDYSFGQAVLRVKDFAPYAVKIKASGAQAVVTGNWGNDLTLLVKAAREVGFDGSFYTFYGNALGAPAAIGDAGVGKVVAVADWLPNVPGAQSEAFYQSFRERFPKPQDDYVHMRMQLMVETLAQSITRAGSLDTVAVARQMEQASVQMAGRSGAMRAADHQFQQPLVVGVMDKQGQPGVKFDVEGSGYGFRVVRDIPAAKTQQPHSCNMQRF